MVNWNKLLDLDILQDYNSQSQRFCLDRGCDVESCYKCKYYNQIPDPIYQTVIEICDLPEDLGE